MKKLIIAAILLAVSAPSQAYEPSKFELCMQIKDAAHVTMRLRQMGESHYEMSKLAQGDATQRMVNNAFNTHLFSSQFLKNEAADRFADEYFDRCLDGDY